MPKTPDPAPPPFRVVRIPKAASDELRARYQTRAAAERRLVEFLAGVLLAKGCRIEDFVSFDDERGELIISEPTD